MASEKIIAKKAGLVDEIVDQFQKSSAVVFFEYDGLTVADMTELRKNLKENDATLKVYKNSLTKRALAKLNYDLEGELVGPKAVAFGSDPVLPIKLLADFRKKNDNLELKTGIVEGKVVGIDVLNELASIPSREGLITMFAGGLISYVKDFAICVDLHRQNLENK